MAGGAQVVLKLGGHAVGSYLEVERRFGPPLPLQYVLPSQTDPGFATWLVRFTHAAPKEAADAPPRKSDPQAAQQSTSIAMVRILGRYRNFDDPHAWLVEASTSSLVDSVRTVMEVCSGAF